MKTKRILIIEVYTYALNPTSGEMHAAGVCYFPKDATSKRWEAITSDRGWDITMKCDPYTNKVQAQVDDCISGVLGNVNIPLKQQREIVISQ